MMQSTLLLCFVCTSLFAAAYGGLLISEHPVGQEVNTTGVTVTLQCKANSDGEIIHWLHNGVPLDPATVSGVNVSTTAGPEGTSTLTITSYETSNAGDYRCAVRAVTSDSVVEVSHRATVSLFTQRTFSTQPQDFSVYALNNSVRQAAAFNCEFESFPRYGETPVIVWEYEPASSGVSTILEHSGSLVLSSFQFNHVGYFQLHTPTESDNGSRVRCIARHPDDASQQVMSDWATLIISNDPRPDDFPVFTTLMPSEVYRVEGQELVLGCSQSTPITSVPLQWIGGDGSRILTAGLPFIFSRNDVSAYGSSNILIPDSTIDDIVGETFSCLVTLDLDVLSHNVTIVTPPPPLPPPTYNDQLRSHTLDYGSPGINIIADTSTANYTGPVQWWINGVPITVSSSKYVVSADTHTLTVFNIDFNDTGLYQAEIVDGQPDPQFLNFKIDVRGGEAFVLPGESEVLGVSGSPSLSLPCSTEGNVPMVTTHSWSLNGEAVSVDNIKYSLVDGSLVINNLELADAGTYSCEPSNALGTSNSTSIRLDVSASVDITWMDGDYPLVGGASNISCITPFPDGLTISGDGVLSASNVQPNFAGEYQCQLHPVHNGDILVTVQVVGGGEAFVLPGESEVLGVSGSSSLSLPCSTEGNVPMVTTHSWSLNGEAVTVDDVKYSLVDGSLVINNVELADAGTYSCEPSNALGTSNSTSIRLDVSVEIAVNWTVNIQHPLVPGVSGVNCSTPFPTGLRISRQAVLTLLLPQLSFSGEYRCQLSPPHQGDFIVNLLVQGYLPERTSITSVSIVDETEDILVEWSDFSDPLKPVDNYTLEVRTIPRSEEDAEDDSKEKRQSNNEEKGEKITTLIISGATTKHVIVDPDFKQMFIFRVEAVNGVGRSGFSEEYPFEKTLEIPRRDGQQERRQLEWWFILLIIIFIILLLCLCCILLLCILLCWRREKRTYRAAKREQKDKKEFESYRQTGDEPDSKD